MDVYVCGYYLKMLSIVLTVPLSVLGPHTLIDGRGGLDLLGYLLATLNGILSNTAVPRALSWGDEVRRLAATSALCVGGEANFERILNSTIPEPPPPPPDLVSTLEPLILICPSN
jgi:hypothetical protein